MSILKPLDISENDVDQEQLRMGIEVELEHTNDRAVAKKIALAHLEEDPKYYTHLNEMEDKYAKKCEHAEVTPDGMTTLEPGIEPLKKPSSSQTQHKFIAAKAAEGKSWAKEWLGHDTGWKELPSTKKSMLNTRWESLKKALLDNATAFMDMSEATKNEQPAQQAPDAGDDQQTQPAEEAQQEQPVTQEQPEQQEVPEEQSTIQDEGSQQEGTEPELSDEDKERLIAEGMKAEGHTDAEIAYVLHGHVPPQATLDDQKIESEKNKTDMASQIAQQKMDHAKALHDHEIEHDKKLKDSAMDHEKQMRDVELDHAQKLKEIERKTKEAELASKDPEIERQHKKRMLDLEYEKAKRELDADDSVGEVEHKRKLREIELERAKGELELDLEFKRQEMKLKLEQKKQMHAQGLEQKQELSEIQHQQAVKEAKTQKPETSKPVKKNKP